MTRYELASLIIAALAFLVSIWSIIAASRNGKEQNKLQKRLLNLEEARERDRQRASRSANLRAWIEREPHYTLIIKNEGDSEARSVKTLIDGQPVLSHPLVPRGLKEMIQLGPGATISYLLAPSMGTNPMISVSLAWQDDSGDPGQWSSQLSLF